MNQQHHEPGRPGASGGTGEGLQQTAQRAQENVSAGASDLGTRGEELAEQAAYRAVTRVEEERERLVGGMRAVARALRQGSQELPDDQRTYGRFVERVADRVDGVSRYLDHHDVEDLTRDVTRIARDNTTAFIGGAFLLGLIGARFAKSSVGQSHGSRQYGRGQRDLQTEEGAWYGSPTTGGERSFEEGGDARGN